MSALQLNPQGFWVSDSVSPPLLFSHQHNACFLTLSVCVRVFECVRLSTEESTRWVCFPSELVNRSRAAFMCRVHYHGDGCDGNPAAAAAEFDRQQLAATIAPPSPSFSLPRDALFIFFPFSGRLRFRFRASPVPTAAPRRRWTRTTTTGRWSEPCRRTASLRTGRWRSEEENIKLFLRRGKGSKQTH